MSPTRRAWLPWIALAAVLVGVVVWAAWPSGTESDAARARGLARELRCPDCESLSAADSQTAAARAIRRDLRERIAEGQTDAQIRRSYADRYGDSILLRPETDGLGLVVWVVPVVVLAVGVGGLFLAFRRWRGASPARATADDESLVREARRQHGGTATP